MHHETDIEQFKRDCATADSFAELLPIALSELRKFPNGAEMVCGPISTGGRGNPEENLRIFNLAIRQLQREGRPIFSQLPYEERIFFFRNRWRAEDPVRLTQYFMPILEDFYRPIMQTGLIKRGWFIPGWESSFGTRWERSELTGAGIEVVDIAKEWIDSLR